MEFAEINEERIESIRKHGKAAQGQKELIGHLEGDRLTLKQAVNAHCYDCTGFFADGKVDCGMKHCPLHPFMPYNPNRQKLPGRTMSEAHMEKMRAARHQESNLSL
jgi:hypothetical protein